MSAGKTADWSVRGPEEADQLAKDLVILDRGRIVAEGLPDLWPWPSSALGRPRWPSRLPAHGMTCGVVPREG
jgi:hypothetical protein